MQTNKFPVKNKFTKNREAGFTLIELLVVMSILTLLVSIVLVSVNGAKKKARDSKRKADMAQISKALEFYAGDNGGYPSSAWPSIDYKITYSLAQEPKMTNYIAKFPKDPSGYDTCYNNAYLYVSNIYNDNSSNNARATFYTLYATLEDQTTSNLSNTGNDAWFLAGNGSCGTTRPNYRLGSYN